MQASRFLTNLFLLLALFIISPAQASLAAHGGVAIDKERVQLDLNHIVEFYIDHGSRFSLADVIREADFQVLNTHKIQQYQITDTHWYRFTVNNILEEDIDLVVKTGHRNVHAASMFQLDALAKGPPGKRLIKQYDFGDYRDYRERVIQSRRYNLYLKIPAGETHEVYLQWQDQGQTAFKMELVDIHTFFQQQMLEQAFSFLTLGFALGILVYNLSILRKTRETVYWSYALYIISFAGFLEVLNGSAALLWDSLLPIAVRPVLIWLVVFLVLFTISRFSSQVLMLEKREPDKAYWLKVVQISSLVFAVSTLLIPFSAAEYLSYVFSVLVVCLCVWLSVRTYRKYHDPVALTFLVAFLPLAITVVVLALIHGFGLSTLPLMDEFLRIAFCLNLVLLSNALADQIKAMNDKQQFYEAKLLAVKANESAKNDFYTKLSHEIRTPLNSIIGTADLLKDSGLDESQMRYVDILESSSKSLKHLVNSVVDLAQVESGKLSLNEQIFDMKAMLLDIEKVMQLRVLETRIPLIFEISEELPREFFGDENCIKQILINFLSNAYKFTERGYVSLQITPLPYDKRWPHKRAVRFEVVDTGCGIPQEQVESIFEDFTQVYSRSMPKYDGAGLGLAISRELSILLGGEISLTSQEGHGSRFYLDVPLKLVIDTENEDDFRIHKNYQLSSRTVLIVDQCTYCSDALRRMASTWGMKVGLVHTLENALQNIRRSSEVGVSLDLLVLEYACLMQEGGRHFLQALKRHSASKKTRVLVVVSQTDLSDFQHLFEEEGIYVCQRQAFQQNFEQIFEAVLFDRSEVLKAFSPYWLNKLSEKPL